MSDTVAFLIMCAVGAFILMIEAHRQFSTPIKLNNKSTYRILDNIDLEDLAAGRALIRGYIFYMALYLLVYAILLTSAQLGDFAINGAETKNGAQGGLPFESVDTIFIDRAGVARPIYITMALVTLLSTGWVQRIERVLRSVAHRLAGIPSGIFKTVTRLNRLNYGSDDLAPYLARSKAFLARHPDAASGENKTESYLLEGLRQVDAVAEAVVTPLRSTVFSEHHINTLSALLKKQEDNMHKLDAELNDDTADLTKLQSRVQDEKRNLQVLFSVLYFKDPRVTPPEGHPPTAFILESLNRKPRDFILNGLIAGAIAMFFVALVLGFGIEAWYASIRLDQSLFTLPSDEYKYRALKSLILAIQSLFIFFGAAFTVAAMRSNQRNERRYPTYTFQNVPYGRLLFDAVVAALVGMLVASVVLSAPDFVAAVTENGAVQIGATAIDALRNALGEAFMYGGAMIFVALAVLLVADQHENLPTTKTCMIAVAGTVVATLLMLMLFIADPGHSFAEALRDATLFFVISLAFLLSFAWIVETAEDPDVHAI